MDRGLFAALSRQFLDRDANETELTAMTGQAERAATHVAAHPAGRNGALFAVEPAHFEQALREAQHEPH